jgi:hypothetical protein
MHRILLPLFLLAALASACGKEPAVPPAAAPAAVENAALGLAIRPLPPGFALAENAGERLSFDAVSDGIPGTATIAAGPRTPSGLNLVAEAKAWGEQAGEAPGGKFLGGNELVTPFGSAFTVRALVEGGTVEERRIYLLHPGGSDRLVTLSLRYPPSAPAAARDRLQQLMDLVSSLEAYAAAAPPPAS